MDRPVFRCVMPALVTMALLRMAFPAVVASGAVFRERPIVLDAGTRERLVSVRLDEGVYRELGPALRAIRVLDSAGGEVPFLVRAVMNTQTRTTEQTAVVSAPKVTVGDGESLTVEFAIDEQKYPHPLKAFTIETDLSNFEQRVDIEWSRDGIEWRRVVEGALLYDYSQYLDARQDRIDLPVGGVTSAGGRFRLVFRKPMQVQESPLVELTRKTEAGVETSRSETLLLNRQPFRMERIRFVYDEERREVGEVETQQAVVRMESNRRDPETGDQEIVLACGGQPIRQLEFMTQDTNFGRTVRVDVLAGKKDDHGADIVLSHLSQGRITRIQLEAIQRDEVKLKLPGTRVGLLRLRIENRNSPPLNISRVVARAGVDELLFLARPAESYRLAYGEAIEEAPAYDTLALEAAVQQGLAAERGALGVVRTVTGSDKPKDSVREPVRLSSWWFLLLVASLVAAVGYGLLQALRRVEAMPGADA